MSAPFLPSPLDCVGVRRFAFYPPLALPDPNEWILRSASRSEVEVVNVQTGRGLWISRQHIGAVSETNDSLLLVGLTQALNCLGQTTEPRVKRIIEMPSVRPQGDNRDNDKSARQHTRPAPVVAIRLESRSDSAFNKIMICFLTGAVVVALLAALMASGTRF